MIANPREFSPPAASNQTLPASDSVRVADWPLTNVLAQSALTKSPTRPVFDSTRTSVPSVDGEHTDDPVIPDQFD